jgi:hypothetical protein
MALTEARRGQIALALLKARLRKEGFRLSSSGRRELGAEAANIGVPVEELEQFVLDLLPELIGNALGYENVSMTVGNRRRVTNIRQMGPGVGDQDR